MIPFRCRILIVLVMTVAFGCQGDKLSRRKNTPSKPSEQTEVVPGYLESIEKDVIVDDETIVVLNETTVIIPKGSANEDYRIRISRLDQPPSLSGSEAAVIGAPDSD